MSLQRLTGNGVAVTCRNEDANRHIAVSLTRETDSVHAIACLRECLEPVFLYVYGGVTLDDKACEAIATIPRLVGIRLPPSGLSATGLETICSAPHLRRLRLPGRDLTGVALDSLKCSQRLSELAVDGARLSTANWRSIGNMRTLESLSFEHLHIPKAGTQAMRGLPNLVAVSIAGENVDAALICEIAEVKGLRHLKISNARLTEKCLLPLSQLRELTRVDLSTSRLDERCMFALSAIPNLEEIDLSFTAINGQHLGTLERLKHLRKLDLSDNQVDDAGLKQVAQIIQLRSLDVHSCSAVTDVGIGHLGVLPNLQDVNISNVNITERALASALRWSRLRTLSALGFSVSDECLKEFGTLATLEELSLGNAPAHKPVILGLDGMTSISRILTLRKLRLYGLPQTKESVRVLSQLPVLEELSLVRAGLDGTNVQALASCERLCGLDLSGNTLLEDSSIQQLRQLKSVRWLDVEGCGISNTGKQELARDFLLRRDGGTYTLDVVVPLFLD